MMLSLAYYIRSRKLQKLLSDIFLTLVICCFSVSFLVSIVVLTPPELANQQLKKEIKNIDEKKIIILNIDYKKSFKKARNLNYYDYNSCNYYFFNNKFQN